MTTKGEVVDQEQGLEEATEDALDILASIISKDIQGEEHESG